MFYEFEDVVPANTAEADARVKHLKLATGIIREVEIDFPAGCQRLAHCTIYVGGHQVWPTNPDSDIAGENGPIKFEEYFPVYPADDWTWRTWNLDETYDHHLRLRISILPEIAVGSAAVVEELKRLREDLLGLGV